MEYFKETNGILEKSQINSADFGRDGSRLLTKEKFNKTRFTHSMEIDFHYYKVTPLDRTRRPALICEGEVDKEYPIIECLLIAVNFEQELLKVFPLAKAANYYDFWEEGFWVRAEYCSIPKPTPKSVLKSV